jgi:hypothetical protein
MASGQAWPMLLMLGTLLAGCSAGDAKGDGTTIEFGDGSTAELAKDAAIAGVVVDQAIRPIGGANVTVLGQNRTTATTQDGLFAFDDLAPGFYTLAVTAAGFLPIQTQAEVREGETSKVRILLNADLNPQPYHTTLQFDWFDAAGVTLVDFTIDLVSRSFADGAVPPQCDRCYFSFATDMPPEQLVFEAVWEDTVAFPAGATSYYWVLDGMDSGEYEDDYCQAPCYVLIPPGKFGNDTNYGLGMTGDEDWITYNQQATIYLTSFYLAGPPEGWSIVAGTGKP